LDSTCSAAASPRRQLADVLEDYLAQLEQGGAPDQEALLAAHPELADELRPYLASLRLLHGATQDLRVSRHSVEVQHSGSDEPAPQARQIGDYRIVREIGRGGMGIVYEAHQRSLNRRVALKILPFAAVLDQRQIARFRNEAQAAAQLHHPNIVPVFAVGQEQGVYYYAMQYIDGQSLEQAIAELRGEFDEHVNGSTKAVGGLNGSTTTQRFDAVRALTSHRSVRHTDFFNTVARLSKEAAEALQHAHEYGIVHRDIKPSNLLLDGQGKLWVTDFGLARVQSDSGVTLTGDVVGTLRYMSPEQAGGQSALVDARTDVYSLGVTMYELLTQQHTFDGDDRQTLLRQIISDEPKPPRRHNSAIPVDLETIVLSAMAKSRDERYTSARAMADDLERYLAGKPTLARRPTLGDRAAKWARRHRSLVAVAACSVLVLSVVSAVGMFLLAREQATATANFELAQENFQRADRHLDEARHAVDQFGLQMAERLSDVPGAETVRRDLLVGALKYYRKFMSEAGHDPQFRHELALAHFKSGVIAGRLGLAAEAIREYRAAQVLLAELANGEHADAQTSAQLAIAHNNSALLLAGRGDIYAARKNYAAAIEVQKRLVKQHADEPVYAGQLAESEANLGMLLDQIGQSAAAEQALRTAVGVLRPLAESRPAEPKYSRNLAIACNNLSFVLRKRNASAAEHAAQEAVAMLQRLADEQPGEIQYQDDLALCYNNLAALKSNQDRLSEAIEWHTRAITLQERLMRKAPAVVRHRSDLAISLNNLGVAYCRAARSEEADTAFARATELLSALADDYPQELTYRTSLGALLNNQALALAGAGRTEQALEIYPLAIESQRIAWKRSPKSIMMRELLSKMYYNYRGALEKSGRWEEASTAALSRRQLWQGNGERLLGVAVELAGIGSAARNSESSSTSPEARQRIDDEVVSTLRQVSDCGGTLSFNLATDEHFRYLHGHGGYEELLAELGGAGPARN
jgi:serine/threonine protein kinase/tetratricopeptide (TPR) repeat protein